MATKPVVKKLAATSQDILNTIRATATPTYREYVPPAVPGIESIREIGTVIMGMPALQNEFLSALVNRIGRVIMSSKMYDNPWAMFKKGVMEYGETVEEVFTNIAKAHDYDIQVAEDNVFKRELPDVRSAFHILNYQKMYKRTIQREQLRQAFLSEEGVTDLATSIINSMYAGAAYDEFMVMKYLLALHLVQGDIHTETVGDVSADNASGIVTHIKNVSNNLTFMSPKYNMAGVQNYTGKEDQYIIVNSTFDATMDVEVLAAAFNMDRAQFAGHRVLVDSFGELDTDRLKELIGNDPGFHEFTADELKALDAVPAVMVDREWFMIFDNMFNFSELYNPEGLYWNYWYHTWKILSVSPFMNAVAFIAGEPSVTSVTVTPASTTMGKGTSIQLKAEVKTTNFASQAVVWSIESGTGATVDQTGCVTLTQEATGEIKVKATSAVDDSQSATCTITVSE